MIPMILNGTNRWSSSTNAPNVLPRTKISDLLCVGCVGSPLTAFPILTHIQIVDSIMALFRVDFSGRGELSERQQKVSAAYVVVDQLLTPLRIQLAQVWQSSPITTSRLADAT